MKRIITILFAAFLCTILVGSVQAAPKVKTPNVEITIISVVGSTIYYTIEWSNLSKEDAVNSYFMRVMIGQVVFGGVR